MTRWPSVRLAELTTKVGSGATPRGGSDAYKPAGIPLIRSMNIHFDGVRDDGLAFIDDVQARELDGATVRTGDVLLNITGASIGRVAIAPERLDKARVNQHVCIIRTRDLLDPLFLKLFLNAPAQQSFIMAEEAGATRQALTKEKILNFEVPLPPRKEQHRIVAKLEALQTRSRRAREALDAVPPLLEKLRQSILAAAFRGDLTKDWRAQQKDLEPATELLERIRTARRQKWESTELAKLKSKGRPPTDDKWKVGYKEPEAPDTTGLPDLPQGWCWTSVGEMSLVAGGLTKNAGKRQDGPDVPLISVAAVQLRRIDVTEASSIRLDASEGDKGELCAGDLLLVEGNGSLSHIGRVALWNNEIAGARHQNHLIRVRPVLTEPAYALEWLASPFGRQAIVEQATSATGLYTLSISKVEALPIPMAPRAEQLAMLALVQSHMDRVGSLASLAANCLEELGGLDRSVLAKAFRGELVPQDLNDEPAEAMLARERSASGSAPANGTPQKRGRPRSSQRADQPND